MTGLEKFHVKGTDRHTYAADMENVMSVTSAACVKFQSRGKFLAFNIPCFVVNVLSVAIL